MIIHVDGEPLSNRPRFGRYLGRLLCGPQRAHRRHDLRDDRGPGRPRRRLRQRHDRRLGARRVHGRDGGGPLDRARLRPRHRREPLSRERLSTRKRSPALGRREISIVLAAVGPGDRRSCSASSGSSATRAPSGSRSRSARSRWPSRHFATRGAARLSRLGTLVVVAVNLGARLFIVWLEGPSD